eukprot:SAG31_NODE_5867_length_2282_cov_13.763628_1_plen_105_part_00
MDGRMDGTTRCAGGCGSTVLGFSQVVHLLLQCQFLLLSGRHVAKLPSAKAAPPTAGGSALAFGAASAWATLQFCSGRELGGHRWVRPRRRGLYIRPVDEGGEGT